MSRPIPSFSGPKLLPGPKVYWSGLAAAQPAKSSQQVHSEWLVTVAARSGEFPLANDELAP